MRAESINFITVSVSFSFFSGWLCAVTYDFTLRSESKTQRWRFQDSALAIPVHHAYL